MSANCQALREYLAAYPHCYPLMAGAADPRLSMSAFGQKRTFVRGQSDK